MSVKSLPNPAWLFLGNVFSHMACVSLGQKNHKMRIAHRPIRFEGDVRYPPCISLGQKITRCASHIDRFDSMAMCDICFVFLGQKNHKMRVAHRPIPGQSGLAISRKRCFPHGLQRAGLVVVWCESPHDASVRTERVGELGSRRYTHRPCFCIGNKQNRKKYLKEKAFM